MTVTLIFMALWGTRCADGVVPDSRTSFAYMRRGDGCEGYYELPVSNKPLMFEPVSFTDGSERGLAKTRMLSIDWNDNDDGKGGWKITIERLTYNLRKYKDLGPQHERPYVWKMNPSWGELEPKNLSFLVFREEMIAGSKQRVYSPAVIGVDSVGSKTSGKYRLLVRASQNGIFSKCRADVWAVDSQSKTSKYKETIGFCKTSATGRSLMPIDIDLSMSRTGYYLLRLGASGGDASKLIVNEILVYHKSKAKRDRRKK